MLVNHHGDQPILKSARIKLQVLKFIFPQCSFRYLFQPGTDNDVQISPSFTKTSSDAKAQFSAEERGCYTCDEVTFSHLINSFENEL